jgi:hypothetical protein
MPYMYLRSNTTGDICTPCTSKIIGAYINFETVTPYAIGIPNSPLLRGQVELWNRIKQCPQDYVTGLLSNTTGAPISGASRTMLFSSGVLGLVAAGVAAAMF